MLVFVYTQAKTAATPSVWKPVWFAPNYSLQPCSMVGMIYAFIPILHVLHRVTVS